MRAPWIIAHRGASGHAPENTLSAFQRAVELGAGFIETDLRLTRDGRFVAASIVYAGPDGAVSIARARRELGWRPDFRLGI